MTEQEEFEFRHRFEQEQTAPQKPRSLVEQIPGAMPLGRPTQQEEPGLGDKLAGYVEAPLSVATGALAGIVGAAKGAVKGITGGKYGTPEGVREAAEEARQFSEAGTYVPRSQTGRDILRTAGRLFEESKLAGLPIAGAELPAIAQATAQQGRLLKAVPSMITNSPEADLLRRAGSTLAPKNATLNPVALETLQAAQKEGYGVTPSSVNPTFANTTLESIAGKLSTAQEMSNRNQAVTESLARRAVGLPESAPLTSETMQAVRKQAWDAGYAPLAQVGEVVTDPKFQSALDSIVAKYQGAARSFPGVTKNEVMDLINGVPGMHGGPRTGGLRVGKFDSGDALQAVQVLRDEASTAFRNGESGVGIAKRQAAKAIEDQIERSLARRGGAAKDLLQNFREARTQMAKSHSLEDAIREGSGTLDAKVLARQLQNGEPLSGDLLTIANFANTFENVNKRPGQVGGPGVHNLRAWGAAAFGGAGAVAGGPLGATIGAAAPFVVPRAVRNMLLSPANQRRLLRKVTPSAEAAPSRPALALEEGPYVSGGLPPREFPMNTLLHLADEAQPQPAAMPLENLIDFPLRQEVLQRPEIASAIDAFRSEAAQLQKVAENAISPAVRQKAAQQLAALQEEFAEGMKMLGVENAADAHGLNRPLYESGRTQLPIRQTFVPMSSLLRR